MHKLIHISILLSFQFFNTIAYAQTPGLKYDHIGYAEGLSGQLVRSIILDDFGHLWIATFGELNKYDGFQTKIFDSSNSILGNGVFIDLLKDASGNIWSLQTDSIGLSRFDNSEYMTHTYQISVTNPANDKTISFLEYINSPKLDEGNLIWVFQRGDDIYLINKNRTVYRFDGEIQKLFTYDSETEFVGITDKESYCIVNENNTIQELNFQHELLHSYDEIKVSTENRVEVDESGNIIFLDQSQNYFDGLYILEYGQVISLPNFRRNIDNPYNTIDKGNYRDLPSNTIRDANGITLIGGLVYFSQDTIDLYTKLGLDFHMITDIAKSTSGTYFIANDLGVSLFKQNDNFFTTYKPESSDFNSVRGMLKYDDIIITKSKDNLIYANSPNDKYDVEFLNRKIKYGIGYYRDLKNPDHVWVCGYVDKGIKLIDLKNQVINTPGNVVWKELNNFYHSSITDILYAYGMSGLYQYSGADLIWSKVKFSSQHSTTPGINHIIETNRNLCLATDEGLIIFDELQSKTKLIQIQKDSILLKLSFINQDKKDENVLWLGTKHNGLVRYDLDKDEQWIINTDAGLSNNNVHAILEDDLNRLWISTNKHLNCLNKIDSSIYVFTTEDGLSHEEFNKYSYYQDEPTGDFYFGGLEGFNYFNPKEIDLESKGLSKINLIDVKSIKSDGRENLFVSDDIDKGDIKIYDDDVVINFNFTLNDLFNAGERKFYYRITELNSKWTKLNSNKLSINKLPYGSYTLEVVADKYSAGSRSELKQMTLEFVRPFYKSWLFILCSFLILSLLVYLWYRNRTQRILNENRELEKQVNLRTEELKSANETKNKILAILSHDLKIPMGGLRDYYEKLDFLLKKDRLGEIQEISRISRLKIQNLEIALENLLNWALAESKTLKSKAELLSLNFEVKSALELFDHIIENKNLEVNYDVVVLDQVMVDKNIMQTVLRNIIHNALKFSYPGGKVEINKLVENEEFITLSIRDYGVGINPQMNNPKDLSVLDANQGLGFGLTTSQDLAKIGDIGLQVVSDELQGTKVLLKFPKLSAK